MSWSMGKRRRRMVFVTADVRWTVLGPWRGSTVAQKTQRLLAERLRLPADELSKLLRSVQSGSELSLSHLLSEQNMTISRD